MLTLQLAVSPHGPSCPQPALFLLHEAGQEGLDSAGPGALPCVLEGPGSQQPHLSSAALRAGSHHSVQCHFSRHFSLIPGSHWRFTVILWWTALSTFLFSYTLQTTNVRYCKKSLWFFVSCVELWFLVVFVAFSEDAEYHSEYWWSLVFGLRKRLLSYHIERIKFVIHKYA